MSESVPTWRPFDRVPNANAERKRPNSLGIAAAIEAIPPQVALTPFRDKRPYRKDPAWTQEPPVEGKVIRRGILDVVTRQLTHIDNAGAHIDKYIVEYLGGGQ